MHSSLNDQQQIAAKHVEGPLLVLAGAGSGKTRIITHRIGYLLELGIPASDILAVTFTNKAAAEMRERIHLATHKTVLTCTFHSLCARILRESIHLIGYSKDFTIYDEEDSLKVLKEVLNALNIEGDKGTIKSMRLEISQAKNALLPPEACEQEPLKSVYRLYQQKLQAYQALDFDDLLFLTVQLFKKHPEALTRYQTQWRFILIDEYQDTNGAQYALVRLLAEPHQNIFAVGDPDQSIYSWRGANIQNILNFQRDFPGARLIPLEQNYRSRSNILEAANALISHNLARYEKNLWSARGDGEKIHLFIGENEHAEVDFVLRRLKQLHKEKQIPLKECVIFYRTHSQSRIFEDALLRNHIPYQIVGGLSFYQRKEIKDILAILRMVLTGSDPIAFARTINLPKRGIGEATIQKIVSFSADHHQHNLLKACRELTEGNTPWKPSPKQRQGLQQYIDAIDALKEMVRSSQPLSDIIRSTIERLHYLAYLKEDPETYQERKENIDELISKSTEWEQETAHPTLVAFLEELSLKSSADEKDPTVDHLRLMTFHTSKGLEFTAVFMVGMEEDLFPHINSRDLSDALEEERRLCYVGMTRAKEYLHLSASRYRLLWGSPKIMSPSRFLKEIPSHFFYKISSATDDVDTDDFSVGATVMHKDFGEGVIHKVYETSFGATYDVYFPASNTLRSLVAKFAKLSIMK